MNTLALALLACCPQADPASIDAKIAAAIAALDADRLEQQVKDLVACHSRHPLSGKEHTGKARDYLHKTMAAIAAQSDGCLTVAREVYKMPSSRLRQQVELVNIVATLKGSSDPGRIYVVGGHYDSINRNPRDAKAAAPGANDDGSGTSVVLEICRVMSRQSFPATIKFVCYDGEEQGLLGSKAHADALHAAGAKVHGMITNDIVGNTLGMDGERRRGYLRCFSYSPTFNDSPGRQLARAASYATGRHVEDFRIKLIYRGDRFGRGGDHASFYAKGYPALRFTEPREDYSRQHQNVSERDGQPYGDLPRFLDYAYMKKVAASNIALLAHLASAPPVPQRVRVQGARDAYDTLVSFTPVEGAHAYELVWRDTTAPDWEGARLIAQPQRSRRGLRARLEGVCVDDVVVGVRAVAKDGARSPARTPTEPDSFRLRRTGRQRNR